MSPVLKRHACSIFYLRGSPQPHRQPKRCRHPAASCRHICMVESSSEWSFTAVARTPGSSSPIASPGGPRRCGSVSENLTNKETDRIHMAGGNQAAGRDGESLRDSQTFLRAKQKNKIYPRGRTCFPLHHIIGAAPAIPTGL